MKLVTKEEIQEFDKVTRSGGLKGLALGLGVSVPGSYYLQKYSPRYRALPMSLKSMGVILVTAPAVVIWAEQAGIRFDKERYSKSSYGIDEIQREKKVAQLEEERASQLPFKERAREFATKNKYSMILGGWATTMAGAWAYISRDPYMTNSQKIVQVRMWAQGATIALIIGTAIASNAERKKLKAHPHVDHSWMDQLQHNAENTPTSLPKVTTSQ